MTQQNEPTVALDDIVQELIATLAQSRERFTALAQGIRTECSRIAGEADRCRQQANELAGGEAGLAVWVAATRQELDRLMAAGIGGPQLDAALETWADARGILRTNQERVAALTHRAEALDAGIAPLTTLSESAFTMSTRLEVSGQRVAGCFRDLGSKLETAQQGRGLGLHVIRAQEEERRRLAREIHDGPAQLLNSVVLRINVCQKLFETDQERLYEELNQLKELVRLSLQDVRKIIFDLRPMALDDLGLIPALRQFLKDYQGRTGIETDLVSFGNERRFDSSFEVALFRLVQEGLNNVYKHAGATRTWVRVEMSGGRDIRLTVRDNGVGFDVALLTQAKGGQKFGLVGMRERAELLGGSMEIVSAPGQGTRLNFTFPWVE